MMTAADLALISAGVIGCSVAAVHGVLVNRLVSAPIERAAERGTLIPRSALRLLSPLIQVSTLAWIIAGLSLIYAGMTCSSETRWVIGLTAAVHYLYGAVGNAWATRGWHPGWMLMTLAVVLIGIGLAG